MGSSLTSQSTPFIQIDPTEHCQLLSQTAQYQVFQNHRGEQYQKYLVNKSFEETRFNQNKASYPKQYLEKRPSFQQNYEYRLTHRSKYFVQLFYTSPRSDIFSCNFNVKKGDYDVVTERIVHRLNDMYNLSFNNAITILNVSLRGFKNLYNYNGTLWIKDSMIGVNQNAEVRVWLNANYALNVIEPLPVSLLNLPLESQQDLIVNNLIDMISSKTYPSAEWKELMKLRMEMMSDSRIKSVTNHATSSVRQNSYKNITHNRSFHTNGHQNGKGQKSEYDQSNRMSFDLALEMVEAVLIRFGMQDIRDSNKVYDLFNEGDRNQMVRQNLQINPKAKDSLSNSITETNIQHVQNSSTNNNKMNPYPSRMKQIKSHTGIENSIVNQQMNGKQLYQLTQHTLVRQKPSNTNAQTSQTHTIKTMSGLIPNQQAQYIAANREIRPFQNPFIDNRAQNIQTIQKRESFKINAIQKIPINPFNELLKTPQAQLINADNEINRIEDIEGKESTHNNNFRQIRNSIIVPTVNHNIRINNFTHHPGVQPFCHPTIQPAMQHSHSQAKISFNGQCSINMGNLAHNSSNNNFGMRQNSLMSIGNRSSSLHYSSLSQSPQPLVGFGNRNTPLSYVGSHTNKVSTAGRTINVPAYNNIGNSVIQRRSNGFNFTNNAHISSQKQSRIQSIRPQQTYLAVVANQTLSNQNPSQQITKSVASLLRKVQEKNQKDRLEDHKQGNIVQQNKASISESIIMVDRDKSNQESNHSQQILNQNIMLQSNLYQNKKQGQQILQSDSSQLGQVANQAEYQSNKKEQEDQTERNKVNFLYPDEQQQQPLSISLTPNKEPPEENTQQEQNETHPQTGQQILEQSGVQEQKKLQQPYQTKSKNLIVVTSYNENEPNQQVMQISVKQCSTPDGSFVEERQDLSDIPYDERQDRRMDREYEGGFDGLSNGHISETGKFIIDLSLSKEHSPEKEWGVDERFSQDGYEENTLANYITQSPGRQDINTVKYQYPTSKQVMISQASSSNDLVINGSTQTDYDRGRGGTNIAKSNTSSEGMYNYELKDTVNLFSLNSIHSPPNFNHPITQNHSKNGNGPIVGQGKDDRTVKGHSIEQKSKQSQCDSEAYTIINKLNKWDGKIGQGTQRLNNVNHGYQTSNSDELSSSNELNHFNGLSRDRQTQSFKVKQMDRRKMDQPNYSQSMAQQIRHQIVGENNKRLQMTNNGKESSQAYMYSNQQANGFKTIPGSYVNSQYFSKYFHSINPQSTKNTHHHEPNHHVLNTSPLIKEVEVYPLDRKEQYNPSQQSKIKTQVSKNKPFGENLTYKQLRNLLNSSTASSTPHSKFA